MRHSRSRSGVPFLVLLVCGVGAGAGAMVACTGSEPFVELGTVSRQVVPDQPVSDLRIRLRVGQVRVMASPNGQIGIDGTVLTRESIAKERAVPLRFEDEIRFEQRNGVVELASVHDEDRDHDDWHLNLVVAIPDRPAVDVELDVGQLHVTLPAAQALHGQVSAGQAIARLGSVDERVDLVVDAGSVQAEITDGAPAEGVMLQVDAGNAVLSLPPETQGRFDLSSDVGKVSSAPRYGLRSQRKLTSASAAGTVGSGHARFVVHADVGNVELR